MKSLALPIAALAGAALSHLVVAATAPAAEAATAPATQPPVVDDARRAAAQRVLAASRFRARQTVLLDDSIRAARADLQADCLTRASEGRSLAGCQATGRPDQQAASRLADARGAMLDEIMVASQTIYARNFSAAEMDEITRFFKTPVGQKYGQAYPQIIADVQERKRAIVRKYLIASAQPGARRQP